MAKVIGSSPIGSTTKTHSLHGVCFLKKISLIYFPGIHRHRDAIPARPLLAVELFQERVQVSHMMELFQNFIVVIPFRHGVPSLGFARCLADRTDKMRGIRIGD